MWKHSWASFNALLISHYANGASANIGHYKGACSQIKGDGCHWMLTTHCANHRLEQAISDTYKMDSNFK